MQAPWKHAYEQQSEWSPQAYPTALQVEAALSRSGSPLMRHPATAPRTRVARNRFRNMAGPLEPVRDAERRGVGGEVRAELEVERDGLEHDAPARGDVGGEAEAEPRDDAGHVLAVLRPAEEHLRPVVALEGLAEAEAGVGEEGDAGLRAPEDARGEPRRQCAAGRVDPFHVPSSGPLLRGSPHSGPRSRGDVVTVGESKIRGGCADVGCRPRAAAGPVRYPSPGRGPGRWTWRRSKTCGRCARRRRERAGPSSARSGE